MAVHFQPKMSCQQSSHVMWKLVKYTHKNVCLNSRLCFLLAFCLFLTNHITALHCILKWAVKLSNIVSTARDADLKGTCINDVPHFLGFSDPPSPPNPILSYFSSCPYFIVWPHFKRTLLHILPSLPLGPKPTTSPLKSF